MSDVSDDEFNKRFKQVKENLPKMQKDIEDFKRLLALAKQSPFAGANADFLQRVELEWEKREGTMGLAQMITEVLNERGHGK